MDYIMACSYCGARWKETAWSKTALEESLCKCKSKVSSVTALQPATGDVFGYRFSPPFKEVREEYEYIEPKEYLDLNWSSID